MTSRLTPTRLIIIGFINGTMNIKIVHLLHMICCKANIVELKQTKLSDRSTVGRVWDSEFEGYRFDSRNRQIFATSENSKIYFSNIIQITCYLEIFNLFKYICKQY